MDEALVRRFTRGRGLFSSPVIDAGQRTCLAVDVVDRWAGSFDFSLNSNGDADSDGVLYYRGDNGEWEEATSGGAGYASWDVPWSPSVHRWDGEAVVNLGCSGTDFDDDNGNLLVLLHIGFVRQEVARIEVDDLRGVRPIDMTSPVGGFAVLSFGAQPVRFRYLDRSHSVLSQSSYEPH